MCLEEVPVAAGENPDLVVLQREGVR